jgi:hypothetical protein
MMIFPLEMRARENIGASKQLEQKERGIASTRLPQAHYGKAA